MTEDTRPAGELITEALSDATDLARAEMALAVADVREDARKAMHAAIGFGVAFALAVVLVSCVAVAVILALGGTPAPALGVAAVFLVLGVGTAVYAYRRLPTHVFERTRARLRADVRSVKEHAT